MTAIYLASSRGQSVITEILLQNGASPNVITSKGYTPLLIAVLKNDAATARVLMASSWINQSNLDGTTPLHFAAMHGNVEITVELLSRGAAVNQAETSGDRRVPLHYAVGGGHYVVVKLLLEHHADKGRVDRTGETPLQLAVRKERADIIQLFERSRVVSEDVLNDLLDHVKMNNRINRENSELIKRSMGLMQSISKSKCPTCIAILPAPKEALFSKETLTGLIFNRLHLHIMCEAENEVHFTGEFFPYDKVQSWLANILPFVEIALTIVQIASVTVGAANIVPSIKDYLEHIGASNAPSILDTIHSVAKFITKDIKSDLYFSSAEDAVKALDQATRNLKEADYRALANFLSNKSLELKQRGVLLSDGNMAYKYLCKRHYIQYDQSGSKVPEAPSYPYRPGTIKILFLHAIGVDSKKARVEIKLLCADSAMPSIRSNNREFRWTTLCEIAITRINWLLNMRVDLYGDKCTGLLCHFTVFDLVDQLVNQGETIKEYIAQTKGNSAPAKVVMSLEFIPKV